MADDDLVSIMGVGKPEDTASIADSAIGTSSDIAFTGVSQLSEVRVVRHHAVAVVHGTRQH